MGAKNTYSGVLSERLQSLLQEWKEAGAVKSDSEVARAVGVSSTALSNFAWGNTGISTEKVIALAKYFGVSTDYLLGLDDVPKRGSFNWVNACVVTGLRADAVANLVNAKAAGASQETFDALSDIINSGLMLHGGHYDNKYAKKSGFLSFDNKEAR